MININKGIATVAVCSFAAYALSTEHESIAFVFGMIGLILIWD